MKLISNFPQLLHEDRLPENFHDWFVMEENDSEKICQFYSGRFDAWFVKDAVEPLKTKFKFYRKNKTNADLERQKKLLEDIPVFPYLSHLAYVWDRRKMYRNCKESYEEERNFPPEISTEEYLKSTEDGKFPYDIGK